MKTQYRVKCHRHAVARDPLVGIPFSGLGKVLAVCSFPLFACAANGWQPGVGIPGASSGFIVNANDRTDVLSFHNCVYDASEGYPAEMGWTGSLAACVPGTTGAAFKTSVLRRVNYYRALAGMRADISMSSEKDAKCQQAALMMSKRSSLSHTPTADWSCYSPGGAEAAGKSNLSLGSYGPDAIDRYIFDAGSNNRPVGHRRWILYPRATEMGTGDVPGTTGVFSANALWVIGNFAAPGPARFVSWPNAGYSPFPVMPLRWSLSYPGAVFSSANVSMEIAGVVVAAPVVSRSGTGIGDNTIVWEPSGLPASIAGDTVCEVTVSAISGTGVPTSHTYSVTLFDPLKLGQEITLTGSATPSSTGENYAFVPIAGAEGYEASVSEIIAGDWTAGAESGSHIIDRTSGLYPLLETAHRRTGAASFHLTFPSFAEESQSFEINRDILPTAGSALTFHDRFRFVTSTSRLSAEISTDNGLTWQETWGRNGTGAADSSFSARSVSLGIYAGEVVRVRFVFRHNGGSTFLGTLPDFGAYVDDIAVSASTQLSEGRSTSLASGESSFRLDSVTAGVPLVAGREFSLRVRPMVGCRWFGYGSMKPVTVALAVPTGFPAWAAAIESTAGLPGGTISANPRGDPDGDGIPNLVEYAFSTSPVSAGNDPDKLPRTSVSGGMMRLAYRVDTSLPVSVAPQASWSLAGFGDVGAAGAPAGFTDVLVSRVGTVQNREARLPASTSASGFMRIRVVER